MITFTRCAFMAKQACATFSQVVQKITPPIANNFLKLFFALFAMLALGVGNAWGAEVTIKVSSDTWTKMGTSNSGSATEVVKNGITVSSNKGYKDGTTAIREYSGGNITVSSNDNITKIVFTSTANKGSKYGPDNIALKSGSAGTYTTSSNSNLGTWTGTAKSITFTCSAQFRWKQVVVTTESSHTVTWTINPAAGGSLSPTSGTSTTVTPNVAYTYGSPAYTVTPAGKANVSQDGDNFTATPSANCTIQINMVAKPEYTVNWYVNESKEHFQTDIVGTTLTNIPDLEDYECGGKVFVGWTTHSSYEHATDAPNDLITNTTGMTIPENGEDYYAVFAESGGTPTTSWSKTDIANIKSTDEVVITMSNGVITWALRNDYGTSAAPYAESITITNEQISSKVGDVQIWNISNSSGNLTIYPKGKTTTWLYCTDTNNGVRVGTNTNKTFTISGNYLQHTVTERYIGVYTSNPDWRCYDKTTSNIAGQTLAFYKKTTTGGYKNYTTSCVKTYKVTFNANGYGTAPTAQNVEENKKATEPTAPSATGYTFGGWYTDQACSDDKKFDFNTPITKDITLYAKWTANTYKITFNAGTGTCGTESATATYADGFTLPTATPSDVCDEVGWTFAGWATSSVAETTSAPTLLKANDKYQPTSSITLYAVYSQTETNLGGGENSATLTFDNTSKRTEFTTEKQVWTENGITLTNIKGTQQGAADVGDYSNPARLYKGSTTLVETSNEILKIVFTCSSSAYANVLANTIGNTAESSESIVTVASVGANSYAIPALGDQVRLKSITVTYTASGTSTTTYNSNPNCTPPSEYTITWWANGEEYYTQTAVEGTAIDVPTNSPNAATYACDDKVFVGWVGAEIIGSIDTKPTFITEFGEVEGDKAFFAVFATEQSSSTTTSVYKLVTNISGGKEYIFATGNSAGSVNGLTCDANSNLTATSLAVKVSDGLTYIETPASNNVVWNITGSSSSYQAQNKGQSGKYLRCYGTAPNAVIDETARALYWDTSKGLYGKSNSGSTSYYLYYDASSSKWGAKSSPSGRVYAFEKSEITFDNTTYSGYVTTCEATTEALSGKFSTGKYEYAEFATGNLQYKPSTDTWRFAKQQYQYVGEANINVGDPNYKGWIDMLGWSTNDADNNYGVNPNNVNDLYDGTFQDWGDLFSADENWSTLSADQWKYLLNDRTNASSLKQIARVGSVVGIMLFPDNWNAPLTVTAQHDSYFDVDIHNYTLDQWAALENDGAVFLPAAGRRTGGYGNMINKDQVVETNPANLNGGHYKHQDNTNIYCYYWTSTINESTKDVSYLHNIQALGGDKYTIGTGAIWGEKGRYGQSVRLAKVTSTLIEIGGGDNSDVITANAGQKVNVQVNRTFKANDGYYTICLPFDLDAEKIGKALQISSITENVAEQGMNVVFTEVTNLVAGQPYLLLPSKNIEDPIFEGVTIINTTGETTEPVSGAGINITFTGIINGVGEQTNGTTHYYVGDYGYLYNGKTEKLGLRAFFTITDDADQPVKVRARVVVGENTTTGVDNSQLPITNVQKVIENGQLIIIRNGEKFNAQGQKL